MTGFAVKKTMPKGVVSQKKLNEKRDALQGEEWDSDSSEDSAGDEKKKVNMKAFELQNDFVDLVKERISDEKKSIDKSVENTSKPSNVIYLGRIPHGFYEDQMTGFFTQFGTVTRLRLSRNKKTGKSKHYAFVEFQEHEVAKIVAETMSGYRLFDHTLSCELVPRVKIHEMMFAGWNKKFRPAQTQLKDRQIRNEPRTNEQQQRVASRLLAKENKKRALLADLGIDYEFAGYRACAQPKSKHIKF